MMKKLTTNWVTQNIFSSMTDVTETERFDISNTLLKSLGIQMGFCKQPGCESASKYWVGGEALVKKRQCAMCKETFCPDHLLLEVYKGGNSCRFCLDYLNAVSE